MRFESTIRAALVGVLTLTLPRLSSAATADAGELQALREQVRALELQLKALALQIEAKEPAPPAKVPPAASATVADKGYTLDSTDAVSTIRLRALLQFDSRLFFNDGGIVNTTFILRRARLITEGTLAKIYGYQFVTEFAGSAVSILDANFTAALTPALQLKIGKFKTPVGLEALQSDSATAFTERSMLANFLPSRDLGVQAAGDLLGGRLSYAVGIFNGIADGANSTNVDFDNDKDGAARVTAKPFKSVVHSPLAGLLIGLGASGGRHKTVSGRASGYRTDGQQTYFVYNSGVVADGPSWRLSPQLDYRLGPLGTLAEYLVSSASLRPSPSGRKTRLEHRGWQLTGSYVLTGEDSSYVGVVPRHDFDFTAGTWGAFEVFARVSAIQIDDAAFPLFASPAASADRVRSVAFAVMWHLSKSVRFKFDYYQTEFGLSSLAASPAAPLLRQDEKVFVSRFQLTF